MKVKSESEVAQSCLTLSDLMDCSPPGSSVHGIFQARVLEWGAIAFSAASHEAQSKNKKSRAGRVTDIENTLTRVKEVRQIGRLGFTVYNVKHIHYYA